MLRLFAGYVAVRLRLCFPVLAMIRFLSAVCSPRMSCATFLACDHTLYYGRFHFVRSFIAVVPKYSIVGWTVIQVIGWE
jgi:hypothetical protein